MNQMVDPVKHIRRALQLCGGLYDFEDIMGAIEDGHMQSHSDGHNWIVTRISVFPRKKVLEIILAVGTYDGIAAMEPAVLQFGRDHSCEAVMTSFARLGWNAFKTAGWSMASANFVKDL